MRGVHHFHTISRFFGKRLHPKRYFPFLIFWQWTLALHAHCTLLNMLQIGCEMSISELDSFKLGIFTQFLFEYAHLLKLPIYQTAKPQFVNWARFPPQLPFSSSIIISDKIKRKMSLSLLFLVLPQISLKILWDNKNIDKDILIFQIPFLKWREKIYFKGFCSG